MRSKAGMMVMAAAVLTALAGTALSQAVRPMDNSRITDESAGYSFSVPNGWTSNRSDAGYGLVNPANTIIIIVRPHNYSDFRTVLRETTLDPGSRIIGDPLDLGNGGRTVRVARQTEKGSLIMDYFVSFNPGGGGAVVVSLTNYDNAASAFNTALKLSAGIQFGFQNASTAGSSMWETRLAGKELLYLYSGNGYFEEKHIYLCSSGEFGQTTGSGGFTPGNSYGSSFAGRGGQSGSWTVRGTTLYLKFQNGSVGEYQLAPRPPRNEISLNGKRFFVREQNVCK